MKVFYGIPTYTQFEHTRQAIHGILKESSYIPDKIVVMDNSGIGDAVLALNDLTILYNNVFVIPRAINNLSGAWNDIMRLLHDEDVAILANDDVFPHKDSIKSLVNTAIKHPEYAIINGSGHSGNAYSFFLIRKSTWLTVGIFDEGFTPAYFEDNDYDYRLKLLGLIRFEDTNATFDHIGSATVRAMSAERILAHHKAFNENKDRFIRKWGAAPPNAYFKKPFEKLIGSDDD